MNTLLETPNALKADVTAANDDHVAEGIVVTPVNGVGQGWDAYDVWRRFIKEARDRREGRTPSSHN